ncbi:outer membrane beta-barrel protein [Hymenobacter cellulosivorans]|uniref:PorT family protein n=1 Tax=Hymenobacter cellulosivorans TaxID=2932249 RepID=A0ABY4FE34_9BACT|nr:outer membrane beta-barrel protein [Hymenobacter cellulosivorans]UOQ54239.1 PorT family protein [Hymenobacter cellulosivorans]
MTKSSGLLVAFLLSTAAASAQTTYRLGVRVGGNLANTTEKGTARTIINASSSSSKSPIVSGQVGVVLAVERGKFAFQPALLFSQKGTKIKASNTIADPTTGYEFRRKGHTTVRYSWLEMPLNVVYTLPGETGLQVFAGPYVAVGVGGRARTTINNSTTDPGSYTEPITSYSSKITYGRDETTGSTASIRNFYSRRFDTGFNVGLGYRRGPVQVQAGYGVGLVNLYYSKAGGDNEQSGNNRVAQLTGTYFFK